MDNDISKKKLIKRIEQNLQYVEENTDNTANNQDKDVTGTDTNKNEENENIDNENIDDERKKQIDRKKRKRKEQKQTEKLSEKRKSKLKEMFDGKIKREELIKGLIFKEILDKPRAKRPYSPLEYK